MTTHRTQFEVLLAGERFRVARLSYTAGGLGDSATVAQCTERERFLDDLEAAHRAELAAVRLGVELDE